MATWPHKVKIYKISETTDQYGEPDQSRELVLESDADLQGAMSLKDMMDLGVEDMLYQTVFVKDDIPWDIRPTDEIEWRELTGRIVDVDHTVENSLEAVFEV